MIPLSHYLVLSAILFAIGTAGVFLRRNLISPDAFPYRTAIGTEYDTGDYAKALDEALRIAGYDALLAESNPASLTRDLGGSAGTEQFADALIKKLG